MNRRGILLLTGVPDDYQGPTLSNPWSVVQRGPVEPAGNVSFTDQFTDIYHRTSL